MQTCYCCSGKVFEECCRPILDGVRKASTAEELMRSRYSAYATASVEYILQTTSPTPRPKNFHPPKPPSQGQHQSQQIKPKIPRNSTDAIQKGQYTAINKNFSFHHPKIPSSPFPNLKKF
jgi:SEC-C motif-containing protein